MSRYRKLKQHRNVNYHANIYQTGQAMTETLLVVGLFFILMIGIKTSMLMQSSAVQMLLNSVKDVFQMHLGKLPGTEKKFFRLESNDLFSSRTNSLIEELNMAQPGLIQTRSASHAGIWNPIEISRQSFIEAGNGYGSSDRAVQIRLESSASLWTDAFNQSSNVMGSVHLLSSMSDQAWKRPGISHDFIQPWAGVVPEQTILRSDAWGN